MGFGLHQLMFKVQAGRGSAHAGFTNSERHKDSFARNGVAMFRSILCCNKPKALRFPCARFRSFL
jgi:hypothetical protein